MDFSSHLLSPSLNLTRSRSDPTRLHDRILRRPLIRLSSFSPSLPAGIMISVQGDQHPHNRHHYHHQPQLPGSADTSRPQFTGDRVEPFSVKQEPASLTLLPLRGHDSNEGFFNFNFLFNLYSLNIQLFIDSVLAPFTLS